MEKKEYLNEETYQSGKKKLTRIALIILIVGVLLGGSLIVTGLVKTNIAKKENEQAAIEREKEQEAQKEAQQQAAAEKEKENAAAKVELQANIDSTQTQIDALEVEITKLQREKTAIFSEDRGFSDRYYAKEDEITAKQKELSTLKTELSNYESQLRKIESSFNDSQLDDFQSNIGDAFDTIYSEASNSMSTAKYVPYYMFGAFIIVASCIISGSIYLFAKRREITAFTIQQTMPLAQEGIEKMSPTIGNAAGTIGKEIAKGISSGIKEGSKDEEKTEEK